MNNLERMMKKDGWKLGYWKNCGVKYWSFRKEGFEIMAKDIGIVDSEEDDLMQEENNKRFQRWKENN